MLKQAWATYNKHISLRMHKNWLITCDWVYTDGNATGSFLWNWYCIATYMVSSLVRYHIYVGNSLTNEVTSCGRFYPNISMFTVYSILHVMLVYSSMVSLCLWSLSHSLCLLSLSSVALSLSMLLALSIQSGAANPFKCPKIKAYDT